MIRLNKLSNWDSFTHYSDPRLVSEGHNGLKIQLDSLPINGEVSSRDVYKKRLGYDQFYSSYSRIKGGQHEYYFDPQLARPFIPQLFSAGPEVNVMQMYIDPMGASKPHYCREKLGKNSGFCLSWLRDSTNHREDLLARQLWRRNQNNYEILKTFEK